MNKKTIWQLLTLAVIAAALIFGLPTLINRNGGDLPQQESSQNNQQSQTVTLTVEGLYSNKQVTITTDQTVLQVLQSLNTDPQMRLATKAYSGLGTLVESIAGQTNGTNDEYWQYKVNGVMPQIGADQNKLKAGDAIEWYFAKPDSSEG